jgi:hypothetical protein
MQRLLRRADWEVDGVRDDVRDYVVEQLGPGRRSSAPGVLSWTAVALPWLSRRVCDLMGVSPRPGRQGGPAMTDPYDPPRPRDYALQEELESLREQEREGHATPEEQRRAEQLERRLRVDEHGAEVRERNQDHEADRQDEEERARHRH